MRKLRTIVLIGGRRLDEGLSAAQVTETLNKSSTASVRIDASSEQLKDLDWRQSPARFCVEDDSEGRVMLNGVVESAVVEGNQVEVRFVSFSQRFSESYIKSWSRTGMSPFEEFWSIARMGGMSADEIVLHDYELGPVEEFRVTVPVWGVTTTSPTRVGECTLLPAAAGRDLPAEMPTSDMLTRYLDADSYARVMVRTETVLDAEEAGLSRIVECLGWLQCNLQFGGSSLPGHSLRTYRRSSTTLRLSRSDIVHVRGMTTGREWLRDSGEWLEPTKVDLADSPDLTRIPLPAARSPQLSEAIVAWERAMLSRDRLSGIMALWDSLEFYAASVRMPKRFQPSEVGAARQRAVTGTSGDLTTRLHGIFDLVNRAPLMARIRQGAADDGLKLTDFDMLQLKRIRTIRNEFVHGRSRSLPTPDEWENVVSTVCRMLLYRVAAVGDGR